MLRQIKSLLWSQRGVAASVLTATLLVAGWLLWNQREISDYLDRYENRNQLHDEVRRIERENAELERLERMLRHDGFEKEKVARERLQYVKPGEQVLFLDPPEGAEDSPTPTPQADPPKGSIP